MTGGRVRGGAVVAADVKNITRTTGPHRHHPHAPTPECSAHVDELVARLQSAGYDDITAAHQAVFENIDDDLLHNYSGVHGPGGRYASPAAEPLRTTDRGTSSTSPSVPGTLRTARSRVVGRGSADRQNNRSAIETLVERSTRNRVRVGRTCSVTGPPDATGPILVFDPGVAARWQAHSMPRPVRCGPRYRAFGRCV